MKKNIIFENLKIILSKNNITILILGGSLLMLIISHFFPLPQPEIIEENPPIILQETLLPSEIIYYLEKNNYAFQLDEMKSPINFNKNENILTVQLSETYPSKRYIVVLFVDPNIENVAANKLYTKLGFKKVGKPIFHEKGKTQVSITVQFYELEKK